MEFIEELKFDKQGLIPAVIQEEGTNRVLMVAYMNKESLLETIKTKQTVFYSRSRKTLWRKGETSGNVQYVKEILTDCDGDCLLIKVSQTGVACHTGEKSCFFRKIEGGKVVENKSPAHDASILAEVFNVILDRKHNPKKDSYTNYLFDKGIDKILKKVGEESAETIIAAKNKDKAEIAWEVSDLIYHIMVMLAQCDMTLEDIYEELAKRR